MTALLQRRCYHMLHDLGMDTRSIAEQLNLEEQHVCWFVEQEHAARLAAAHPAVFPRGLGQHPDSEPDEGD